ncbi:putative reverse transcriptase domain-containing protein [Tanacetum coccineum]
MAPERRPTVRRNPLVNRLTNRNNVDINIGIDTQMLDQLIAIRVAEALAVATVTHAASTQEETNRRNPTLSIRQSTTRNSGCSIADEIPLVVEDGALTWWNVYVRSVTLDIAHATPWGDFKAMFIRKYCPRNEVKQMENELWNLKVKGTNLTAYNQHFQELILLCPEMVPNPDRLLERYIEGLPLSIKGRTLRPKTAALHLRPQAKEDPEAKAVKEVMSLVFGGGNQIRGNQQNPQNNQRQNQGNPKGNNQASTSTQGGRITPGRVYNLCAEAAVKDNNVVNGMFLINNVNASVLFDTGADRSFMSYAFSKYIDIPPITLDTNYSMELADGKSLTTNTILRGCTLNLQNHLFKINLLPIELGSFDVIVKMDWMAEHRAEVVCYEKYICVPYKNDMLIIQSGIKSESRLEEEKSETPERRIEDVPIVKDFPKVFPEDLLGLPPTRQVEFHIELIPGAAPVARAPYRLALAKMKELAE